MQRLIGFIFRLVLFAVVITLGLAAWVIWDGLNDHGDHADCAVIPGGKLQTGDALSSEETARLDTAAELYKDGKFPLIIVAGTIHSNSMGFDDVAVSSARRSADGPAALAKYLQAQGVPAHAILVDAGGTNTDSTAHAVTEIMKARHLRSAMVIAPYYRVTRAKWALQHAGVAEVDQAHSGALNKDDVYGIGHEVVGIYDYLFNWYLKPAASKAQVEASAATEKARVSVEKEVHNVEDKAKSNSN